MHWWHLRRPNFPQPSVTHSAGALPGPGNNDYSAEGAFAGTELITISKFDAPFTAKCGSVSPCPIIIGVNGAGQSGVYRCVVRHSLVLLQAS